MTSPVILEFLSIDKTLRFVLFQVATDYLSM